ncbi:alpha/beta hydrolase [Litchfieldia alkalitelluris]|uniref:alpha/beta hydrolase n=1 Tax=Litchfieldia alkalitelluris TaxID=304268 RepID=UPI00099731C5|nr:alpha/beta hydrolase [Litchfieldia alkalitelluris]
MRIKNDEMSLANGKTISYSHVQQDSQSDTLTIILPGAGYTVHKPLLYYSTGVMVKRGFDVLHINYSYSKEELSSLKDTEFVSAIQSVIDHIVQHQNYQNYMIIAKSLGTIALPYLLETSIFHSAKIIWLTPLLQKTDVSESLLRTNNAGLCIIGDQDPCYIKETFDSLKENQFLDLQLIEGADHSLETNTSMITSIDILKKYVRLIEEF